MSTLYAFGRQRPQRAEVLRQAHGHGNFCQLLGGFHAKDAQRQLGQRMGFRCAAHQAHGHGHFQSTDQIARRVFFPGGQGAVMTIAAGIGVGARLDRSPVIARGNDQRVDPVHDAFVVCGGAVRVNHRKIVSIQNAFNHVLALERSGGQQLRGHADLGPRQTQVGEVGQNPQAHLAAGDFLHQRRDSFGHGIHGVGTHRIAHIDNQVGYQHRPARALGKGMHLNIAATATEPVQQLILAVGQLDDFVLAPHQAQAGVVRVRHLDNLHLGTHQRQRT